MGLRCGPAMERGGSAGRVWNAPHGHAGAVPEALGHLRGLVVIVSAAAWGVVRGANGGAAQLCRGGSDGSRPAGAQRRAQLILVRRESLNDDSRHALRAAEMS